MKVTLLAHTELEKTLADDDVIRQGKGTLAENLIEFAGRVCYRSDEKMGHSDTFIVLRVREGHEDIIEHVRLAFRLDGVPLSDNLMLLVSQPTVEFTDLGDESWIVSMNARNVRDFWAKSRSKLAAEMARLAFAITPSVYADLPVDREEVSQG